MLFQPRQPHFSTFERFAELVASELSQVHREEWLAPKLSRFEPARLSLLEKYNELQLKSKTTGDLKVALQTIQEELPQEHINKVVVNLPNVLLPTWLWRAATRTH